MTDPVKIKHEFVEFIPKVRQEGVLYVSIPYATAVHNCFCGCGLKVVTPISPVGWKLTFDGQTVSLFPSIGSWSFPCRSHYFIRGDKAVLAGDMCAEEIEWNRTRDRQARDQHFGRPTAELAEAPKKKRRFWDRLRGR
jgi:Family of unknown function (DUF6527)